LRDGKALAHGYRTLQDWNKWLAHKTWGRKVVDAEKTVIRELVKRHYGKQAVLIGTPLQQEMLTVTDILCQTVFTPLSVAKEEAVFVEADLSDLPIQAGSIDLVILPHTLEFVDNPRQLLSEACRIVKPEGLIVICAFNPYSTWGLKKIFSRAGKLLPHGCHFIPSHLIKNWLQLADFVIETHCSTLYRPPLASESLYRKIRLLETIGSWIFPKAGGISIIVARAKVIPLTPIKMKWKQQLSNIRIRPTIPGNIATYISSSTDEAG
jgi:SAM-dependent methyltransferase